MGHITGLPSPASLGDIYMQALRERGHSLFLAVTSTQKDVFSILSVFIYCKQLSHYTINNMHLQTAFSLFTVSLILPFANAGQVSKVSKVRANPLNGRDVAECVDGQGSGCDELGPWTDADECLAQCYGAEADTGDM